jgi:hypothetical protein
VKGKSDLQLPFARDYILYQILIIFSKSSINGKNAQYMSEDEFEFPKLMPIRA